MTQGKRKKIAIVTATFPPYRGGMGRVAELDAEDLATAGFDVHVYSPVVEGAEPRDGYVAHPLKYNLRYGNGFFTPDVGKVLDTHDLTILHYPFFGGAEPLAWAKKRSKGKLIITYHMDVVGGGLLGFIFRTHTKWWMPKILRVADRVVVTSEDYAAHSNIASLLEQRKEMFVAIPPSIDHELFTPSASLSSLRSRYGIKEGQQVVLFVGGLDKAHYFKGVPRLLQAVQDERLREVKTVIVGKGECKRFYEQQAHDIGIKDRVIFTGGVSDDELADLYRVADVFAFPSLDQSEAFGIAALEALSSGVPVVASALPGVRTIVRDGETGFLIPPGDSVALAEKLSIILSDESLRKRMGENARAMVEKGYTRTKRQERLVRVVEELL